MKNPISKFLLACSMALGAYSTQAQGLEQIIVEQYYEATAADAAASEFGDADGIAVLPAGARTYRIYADLEAGYKLETVFGNTAHPLNIGTTTFFYNQTDRGTVFGETNLTTRLDENTCSIDSYLTFGMAGSTKRGVLKSADADATAVIFPNSEGSPVMENTNAWMGTALTSADGLATGTLLDCETIGIPSLTAFSDNATSSLAVSNGAWFVLGGAQGEDPNGTNRILIAQITTSGTLTFNLNMRVSLLAPGSTPTDYVSSNPTGNEVSIPSLTFPIPAAPDCNGVPGGPALPGTPCNDNDACTVNDLYTGTAPNCGCAGTFADADADGTCDANDLCPGGPEPGTACNDNDACTTGDVIGANCLCAGTFQDADADGTCDANDLCPGGPEPGTACNDNDACTTGDVIGANCLCAGTFQDADADGTCDANDLCPGGPEPGTACDDLDPNTNFDVIGANCLCAGTPIGALDCNGVPGGPALPGTPCDDNDPCTVNDLYTGVAPNCGCAGTFADADADGTCDANDLCPGGPEPGTACNDNDACTTGDVIGANCACAGIFQDADADGTCDANDLCPGGPEPGTACNDLDPNTNFDVIGANCLCAGTPIGALDCNGVPGGPALPGTPCDDNDPCTVNDLYTGVAPNCGCAGTFADADADGTCDANDVCPGGPEPGTGCDDFDPNTIGDVIGANCLCAGINPNCTEDLVLTITLDAFGSQTTWEVRDQTTTAIVASGGPYADGTPGPVLENICVAVGCYQLTVTDANGITGGGYVLTDDLGRRIVDADGQFTTSSSIVVPAEGDFCVPMGQTFVKPNWCDRTDLARSTFIYCQGVAGATGYQFWFFDAHGSYSRRILKPTTACRLDFAQAPLPLDFALNVRVRALVGGNYQQFGKACRLEVVGGGSFRDLNTFSTDEAHLSMYPNPNREEVLYLVIEGLSDEELTANVEIFDAMGRRVSAEQVSVAAGTLNHAMTLSTEMHAGMYFVQVSLDGQVFTERLMRQ